MTNKKIFLIYPPAPVMNREDRCQQPTQELLVIPPLPPMDLMYMASVSRDCGYEPKIKDYSLKNETSEDLIKDIEEFKPHYVVANVTSTMFLSDIKALKTVKKHFPQIKIIVKGAHFLTFNTSVLEEYPFIDLIMRGEVELTLKEILEEKPYELIDGLTYRKNGVPTNNPERKLNEKLDDLPFPARDLVDNNIYTRPDNNKVQALVKVSRGCPFHCFFCLATPVSGAKVRTRSAENIIKELKECVNKHKITNFILWSDVFNFDRNWTLDLCRKIKESGLKITWSANTRADTADSETAKAMYDAGCRLVSVGVESGSQEMLDKMGKKITLEQIEKTIKTFKDNKIQVYNYFVIGLPWESEETFKKTIEFAKKLDSDFISFYTATALPGSRFYKYLQEHNLGEPDYEQPYFYPSVNTHYLSKERVFELHKIAVKSFYLRVHYILKMLFTIRSFAQFKNYFKAGLNLLLRR